VQEPGAQPEHAAAEEPAARPGQGLIDLVHRPGDRPLGSISVADGHERRHQIPREPALEADRARFHAGDGPVRGGDGLGGIPAKRGDQRGRQRGDEVPVARLPAAVAAELSLGLGQAAGLRVEQGAPGVGRVQQPGQNVGAAHLPNPLPETQRPFRVAALGGDTRGHAEDVRPPGERVIALHLGVRGLQPLQDRVEAAVWAVAEREPHRLERVQKGGCGVVPGDRGEPVGFLHLRVGGEDHGSVGDGRRHQRTRLLR
jgi:hypothetical protein